MTPASSDPQTDADAALAAEKAAARQAASRRRKVARDAAGTDAAAALAEILVDGLAPKPGTAVSGFLPIGSEIDVRPALERLRALGCEICLPCVVAPETPLVFRRWREGDPMVTEAFGTRAPAPDAPEILPDILLVPMLAFDAQGYRLGYGGGFYDRSLDALRARKTVLAVGAAFEGQRVEAVPRGPFDQPLDRIATEAGFIDPRPEAGR
jgi:5-formyltetrahydrofolate cyclo-ligase